MTTLIAGGRGLIGAELARELGRRSPGSRVVILDRAPAPGCFACDLRNFADVRRAISALAPSVVFHAAGLTRAASPEELWEAHVTTTVNILEAVLRLKRPGKVRIVVTGSSAEYGDAAGGRAAREDGPARPLSPYAASKLCQTLASLSYRHRGLDVRVARLFNLVGPGVPERQAPGAFASQIARIERGLQRPQIRVGNLAARRDLLDVRDAARALAALAERGRPGQIYNVCSGNSVSIGEILRRLIALSRLPISVRADPSRRRRADIPQSLGDSRKTAAETDFKAKIPLGKSLRDMLAWHRAMPATP